MLYQREMTGEPIALILAMKTYSLEDGEPSDYCFQLVRDVEAHIDVVDAEIEATSENWSLARMPYVDRNILRLAVYEIMFEDEVPDSVVINEAIETAKVYGGDDSSKFVNGVLGKIAVRHSTEVSTVDSEEVE